MAWNPYEDCFHNQSVGCQCEMIERRLKWPYYKKKKKKRGSSIDIADVQPMMSDG